MRQAPRFDCRTFNALSRIDIVSTVPKNTLSSVRLSKVFANDIGGRVGRNVLEARFTDRSHIFT